ncbi:craniofacial development protein 2-like [Antennarius striatus]|uniref:craniofacial development protein 2-like n=1 Tax=Antennarius striatus TaxID=241820 RepID=UPI0035AE9BA9
MPSVPERDSLGSRANSNAQVASSVAKPTDIATWNIRTMFTAGKMTVIVDEMRRYNISILGLCETRWLQTGEVKLISDESILYSGHSDENAPHMEGVTFILSKESQRALISWEPVNSRIITARFQTTHKIINLHVIQCYAPTNNSDEELKGNFHNQLQHLLQTKFPQPAATSTPDQKRTRHPPTHGDINAKVGSNNNGYEFAIGEQGLGIMNVDEEDICRPVC